MNSPSLSAIALDEHAVHHAFKKELHLIASKYLPKGSSALVGRNYTWGKLYSPRFQMGAGRALRTFLVAKNYEQAQQAYRALRAGTQLIDSTGLVQSHIPWRYGRVKKVDLLSAAAFYLGDACLGMLAIESLSKKSNLIEKGGLTNTKNALRRGINWLLNYSTELQQYDAQAPNRLLFDARSFVVCGRLLKSEGMVDVGTTFITLALDAFSGKGYFLEGGGWDTSYQAVAINVAVDILLSGFEDDKLMPVLTRATSWLSLRVDEQGKLNSSGNTRTCFGGEKFLGVTKKVAIDEVFLALAYIGVFANVAEYVEKAKLISMWYEKNPNAGPC